MQAVQVISGVSSPDSQSLAFKNAMKVAIAESAAVLMSLVDIESISVSAKGSSVVTYSIIDRNGNATAILKNLQNSVIAGTTSANLHNAGYLGAFTNLPRIINITPTSRPTAAPASLCASVDLALIIGVTVGSIALCCCCLFCSCYFIFLVAPKRDLGSIGLSRKLG